MTDEPNPAKAAVLAELGGAHGITVHLREDRRHIQDYDVDLLLQTVTTPLNLELAMWPEIVDKACAWHPAKATLVPERREEVTTEGGLDLGSHERIKAARDVTERLQEAGSLVSLFVDPDEESIAAASRTGADAVELHTGEYAETRGEERDVELARLTDGALLARELGLIVHAGHGLTYTNVHQVAAIQEVEELNIGHSVVSRAVMVGMRQAVADMIEILERVAA